MKIFRIRRLLLVVATANLLQSGIAVSAAVPGNTGLPNEEKAYGELEDLIVDRIRLWPGLAPGETSDSPGRFAYDAPKKVWRRYDTCAPEVVLLKPKAVRHETLVVAMPGGGYNSQHMGHIAREMRPVLDSGRWVAVLHYRVPRRNGRKIYEAPFEDAQRAVRILRSRAAQYGYSPRKIGAVGFSAGAHLTAMLATSSQSPSAPRIDELDDLSSHLDFAVPVYPAYVAADGETGPNTQRGDNVGLLPTFKFDAKTPPMFFLHGDVDSYSPMGSVLLYQELHKRKIPAQLFVYSQADHGLNDRVNVRGWQKRIVDWMESLGF